LETAKTTTTREIRTMSGPRIIVYEEEIFVDEIEGERILVEILITKRLEDNATGKYLYEFWVLKSAWTETK
jgi:hypothetical protein